MLTTALFTLAWVGCAILGGAITNSKGRGWGLGVLLGALLSLIGVLIAIALSDVSADRGSRAATRPGPSPGTSSPSSPTGTHRRRHPRGRVIAFLWIALFVIGIVAAVVFQDDNPATDDGAAFGALAAVVGTALTVIYVVGSLLFEMFREHGHKHSDDEALTPR